jgi:hypothetical protein
MYDGTNLSFRLYMPLWRLAHYLCLHQLCEIIQTSIHEMVDASSIADIFLDAENFGL